MSGQAQLMPAQVDRIQRGALVAAAVGGGASVIGGLINPAQFVRSYLFAYLFWAGIAIGCLCIVMLHHLSGGRWGLVIRRILEAGSRTLVLLPVLFLPVALGARELYVWARPAEVAADEVLRHKSLYLNLPFFLARAAIYFVAWAGAAHLLNKWSLKLDAGPDPRLERRLQGLSGGGLVLMGLTITFSSVDWAMSLNPHWFSTIYGMIFMVGDALSALTLVIVLVALMGEERPLSGVLRPTTVHDLGKLLLAFLMLWAYVHLSQFIITWSGNLPEEITWYVRRFQGGWQLVALLLVVLHFALPFVMLLSRELKRDARLLGAVAAGILFARLLDLFWIVAPDMTGHGLENGFALHWLDLAAPIGVGGVWLAFFTWQLKDRPLIPVGEPEIRELLEGA